jgi:DNA processing protein
VAGHFADSRPRSNEVAQLLEHFGSPEAVFRASLTELEATGIQAVSAQSLATGKSAELAREEIAQAAAADITLLSMDDPSYPRA